MSGLERSRGCDSLIAGCDCLDSESLFFPLLSIGAASPACFSRTHGDEHF